ncbi:MAG: hypothetical protein Q4G39_09270 [Brachymonas sp.]|nr:hypothetical protein [Brachymonas sp.]
MPIIISELKFLAEKWVAYWHTHPDSQEREALSWVSDREWDLVNYEPLIAWAMILEILKLDSSGNIQEVLSAGPLESLLAKHGPLVIEMVENEAKQNPQFAQLLGGAWRNSMTTEVWTRVQAVWDRRGWDGNPPA